MLERRKQELELVKARYGEIEVGPNLDWLIIKRWELIPGWNKMETAVLVLIPSGYAVTPPDNFYTDSNLRLADGTLPGNVSEQNREGCTWLQFSYHVETNDWQPHADLLQGHNLLTFLEGVAKRLQELS